MPTKFLFIIVRLSAALILTISIASAASAAPLFKTIYETQKLMDPLGDPHDNFGGAVSISGNLAIVGDWKAYNGGTSYGAAYIYAFDGTSWSQEAKLTAPDVDSNSFGSAVAISGRTVLVGAPGDSAVIGAVYVFTFNGTTWTQQAKLFASDPQQFVGFATSVALLGDTALIGAYVQNPGAAYVFTFDGTSWSEQAKLTAADGVSSDYFGWALSLSENRALIGAYNSGLGGAAYIFGFDGTAWSQNAELTTSDTEENDEFGWAVALSGDVALVGAPKAQSKGLAYTFAFDGATWSQQAKLKEPGGQGYDSFGSSVALSDKLAVVGANHFTDPGRVYAYSFRRNAWRLIAEFLASDGTGGDYLGVSVALSGKTILAGANDTFNPDRGGEAYIFSVDH